MATLRKPTTEEIYKHYLETLKKKGDTECPLCIKEPLHTFTYWNIVENSFPYDAVAKKHDMLIPKRHVTEDELTEEEMEEFMELKRTVINDQYNWMLEPTFKGKTIPEHFHLHLIVGY